jgi:hypothetical protein
MKPWQRVTLWVSLSIITAWLLGSLIVASLKCPAVLAVRAFPPGWECVDAYLSDGR